MWQLYVSIGLCLLATFGGIWFACRMVWWLCAGRAQDALQVALSMMFALAGAAVSVWSLFNLIRGLLLL